MLKEHDEVRKKLWCDVYVAYVNASNSTSMAYAKLWADRALKDFDETFKNTEQDNK